MIVAVITAPLAVIIVLVVTAWTVDRSLIATRRMAIEWRATTRRRTDDVHVARLALVSHWTATTTTAATIESTCVAGRRWNRIVTGSRTIVTVVILDVVGIVVANVRWLVGVVIDVVLLAMLLLLRMVHIARRSHSTANVATNSGDIS